MLPSSKLTTPMRALSLVRPRDTIVASGFVTQGAPEVLLRELGDLSETTAAPLGLTLLFGGGPGDFATKGLNHLARRPGTVRLAVGAHYGQVPMLADLVKKEQVAAFSLPMGGISRMIRATASGTTGHTTRVGLGTFVDPRHEGGRLNESAKAFPDIVSLIETPYLQLFFRAFPVRVALIKATTADEHGNLTFERESTLGDSKIMAMAARASGGKVIAQVERVVRAGTLSPRGVHIPGAWVDYVVEAEDNMSYVSRYDPGQAGEIRPLIRESADANAAVNPTRSVIARRAALGLTRGDVVNLGIGMPEGVAHVAREEGVNDSVTLTTEAGVIGGTPCNGHAFGTSVDYQALVEMSTQFDFYNGGGLDVCYLGVGQVSQTGDVNVSKLEGGALTGPGGFMDITTSTRKVNFLGSFTKGGLVTKISADGELIIVKEGRIKTFKKAVDQITFNGLQACEAGQAVTYVTERAVFELSSEGLKLVEIAPGVDLEKDVLAQMEFEPLIPVKPVPLMDPRVFEKTQLGLAKEWMDWNRVTKRRTTQLSENVHMVDLTNVKYWDKRQLARLVELSARVVSPFVTRDADSKAPKGEIWLKCDGLQLMNPEVLEAWPETIEKCRAVAEAHGIPLRVFTCGGLLFEERRTCSEAKELQLCWSRESAESFCGDEAARLRALGLVWSAGTGVITRKDLRATLERDLAQRISPMTLVSLIGKHESISTDSPAFAKLVDAVRSLHH